MERHQVVALWEKHWGPLSESRQRELLTSDEVKSICEFDERAVDIAIRQRERHSEVLNLLQLSRLVATSAPQNKSTKKRRPSASTKAAKRHDCAWCGIPTTSSKKHCPKCVKEKPWSGAQPHRPADAELHKKIGSTQNYSDDT
jgi:hypothetical protein